MSRTAFEKLRVMLGDMIIVQAHRCPVPEALYPEIIMAIGLQYLSGGKCLDLKNVYSVSLPSVYRIHDLFINAVNSCLIKGTKLPETIGEMVTIAVAFERLSTSGLIRGCVGCIDGFLAATTRPKMGDSNNNPNAYYSGHQYGMYGQNVQAVCDKNQSRFLFFGVAAPGKCGDQVLFERTILNDYARNLPRGYYLIGDAAYSVCESMLTPFTAGNRNDPKKDAFNFFFSQMRI